MEQFVLTTDGACLGNPGAGGWSYIIRGADGSSRSDSGGAANVSNNQMELTAALEGLRSLIRPSRVLLMSDSMYLLDGMSKWMPNWKRRGWTRKAKRGESGEVKNLNLWKLLDEQAQRHQITYKWVRGHAGHADNEACDKLATAAAFSFLPEREPVNERVIAGDISPWMLTSQPAWTDLLLAP